MKRFVALALLLPVVALAQPAKPGDGAGPAAVNTSPDASRTAAAPVAGANSFSETQARSRIEAAGYTDLLDVAKDDKGVWRAMAKRDGQAVAVQLDYQGNVTAR